MGTRSCSRALRTVHDIVTEGKKAPTSPFLGAYTTILLPASFGEDATPLVQRHNVPQDVYPLPRRPTKR